MQSEYRAVLAKVFSSILMKHAFMFAEEAPTAEIPVNDTDHLHATVCFSGQRSGVHGISASTKFCTELAENVLGLDPDDKILANDVSDALEELANIVCGHFLTTAFGEGPVFNLSPPSVSRVDNAKWKQLIDSQEAIGFTVDNDPVIVYVSFGTE